jgi:hypothetical protein
MLIFENTRGIEMVVKRWFVRDHKVLARGGRALENVESRHHRNRDTSYRRIGITGFERVNCIRRQLNA